MSKIIQKLKDLSIPKPEVILFDWDGTLVDSFTMLEQVHEHVHRELGLSYADPGWFSAYFGKPREIIYNAIYGERVGDAHQIFNTHMRKTHKDAIKFLPHARELLGVLSRKDVRMGIVSNKKREFLLAEIEALGVSNLFEVVVASLDAEYDKPSAAPINLALSKMEVEANFQKVWYVGDTENDIKSAFAANILCVFIDAEMELDVSEAELNNIALIENCSEISDFLLQ